MPAALAIGAAIKIGGAIFGAGRAKREARRRAMLAGITSADFDLMWKKNKKGIIDRVNEHEQNEFDIYELLAEGPSSDADIIAHIISSPQTDCCLPEDP